MGSVEEFISVAEAAARKARLDHSTATVTILYSRRGKPSSKAAVGSGFIVKLEEQRCKIMTCEHVIHDFVNAESEYEDGERIEYDLWVRFFDADKDALVTVLFSDEWRDLAILDCEQVATRATSGLSSLRFSKRRKIGIDVVLLGYFNPPKMADHLRKKFVIAKRPNAIPGKIIGPLRHRSGIDMTTFSHSCCGIDLTSGSPMISHPHGRVVGVFDSSTNEIHSAITTKTVKAQLQIWLKESSNEVPIRDLINRL